MWDAVSGECVLGPLEGHTDGVTSVSFSGDGKRIVSGSLIGQCVWQLYLGSACWGHWRGTLLCDQCRFLVMASVLCLGL